MSRSAARPAAAQDEDDFQAWRESFALKVARVDAATPDTRQFRADVALKQLPKVLLCGYDVGPLSLIRSRTLVRDGEDGCSLVICGEGVVTARFDDTVLTLAPGEAALLPHHRIGAVSTDTASKAMWLRFGRDEARSWAPAKGALDLRKVRVGNSAIAIAGAYCRQLLGQEALDDGLAALAAAHVRELTAHLLDPRSELARSAPYGGVRAARLQAALKVIHAHFRDPELSAESVGLQLGFTARYVQKLLDGAGLSFTQHLKALRLDEARRLLDNPSSQGTRITDVAYEVGFQDLSHFNREFRRRFGMTPGMARQPRD